MTTIRPTLRGLRLPTTGNPRPVEYRDDWRTIATTIGSTYIERIELVPSIALYVDEAGLMTRTPTINRTASRLYSATRRAGGMVAGDALVVYERHKNAGELWCADADPAWLARTVDRLLGVGVPS